MAFLPAKTRNHGPLAFQTPTVRATAPEPLVEASSAYPKMEEEMLAARETAWLAFRVFDPNTLLHSSGCRELGLTSWADLLAHKLDEGVALRLLLTDFDPVVGAVYHEDTWRSISILNARIEGSSKPWDLQICPALHEARTGKYTRFLLAPAVYAKIRSMKRELNAMSEAKRIDRFDHLRGYHRYLKMSGSGEVRFRRKPILPHIFPVTHHHKAAVFDGDRAVLGGLDLNERRYDDPDHNRHSIDTWHDVSVAIDGPPAVHVAQHIAATWNVDYRRGGEALRKAQEACARLYDALPGTLDPLPMPETDNADTGDTPMQIVQTASRNVPRTFGFRMRPLTVNDGIEKAHLELISRVETLFYAETQFFRHKPLAEALARRGRECPSLRLVMVLPAAPEDVAFDDNNGLDARFGERLQADCVEMVHDAFGDRASFVCPALREKTGENGRAVVNGAPIIYVHAKVTIADDRHAIVSSANLNGRSMKWDSEVGVMWEGESAGALRRQLATDWIDAEAAEAPLKEVQPLWREVAAKNARLPAQERRGFVLPYLTDEADALGIDLPLMPPETV